MKYFTAHFTDSKGKDIAYIASNSKIDPLDFYEYYTKLCLAESQFEDYIQLQKYFWRVVGDAKFANFELPKIEEKPFEKSIVVWYAEN